MSFCWQTCFYLLYQPALNDAKIKNAAARQLKERRAAAFAVKKLRGGSLPYVGDCYSHTSLIWILPQASSALPPGVGFPNEPAPPS